MPTPPDSQIPDSQITDAFIDHADDFRAMRTTLKINSQQLLAALQRPTVQAFIESLGAYLDATRATRDAIERANLAEALRPSLDHVLDPVLRCRIVSTLIRAAGTPKARTRNTSPQAAAPHRHTNSPAELNHTTSTTPTSPAAATVVPTTELTAITPTTQRTPPLAQASPTPPITHPRQPFLNRAARRAAKHAANQPANPATNQPAPQQPHHTTQPLHPHPTRHAA